MNKNTLVCVFGYEGDRKQVLDLLPMYEHHGTPLVIFSPVDSQLNGIGPHICRHAGEKAYIGQKSWDRQISQMKLMLEYPFDWFLMNDSDSFVLTPELPAYLYEDETTVWGNEVNDFRVPGQQWEPPSGPTWPLDYHKNFPLIAIQPSYFMHRRAVERFIRAGEGEIACPITPFIDWQVPYVCTIAGLKHKPFKTGASCETVTAQGVAVMTQCIERGATFIHSVKSAAVMNRLLEVYKSL